MDDPSYYALIAKLRRMFPRNPDLLPLFDEAERRERERVSHFVNHVCKLKSAANKRERKSYMRDYMRKRRAEARG